jgi:hypothetical protein
MQKTRARRSNDLLETVGRRTVRGFIRSCQVNVSPSAVIHHMPSREREWQSGYHRRDRTGARHLHNRCHRTDGPFKVGQHRFPFAESHQARWNVNWAMGTELFPHREKVADFPLEPALSERLWSRFKGICPQNYGTIRQPAYEISVLRDWLAEREGFEPSVPVTQKGSKTKAAESLSDSAAS